MHQYKTIVQILLVLSILNPAFAAPIRREVTGGTSSSSSDLSPPNQLPTGESVPSQGPAPSSGSAAPSPLPEKDGQVPAHDLTTEASTSAHPSLATDSQVPEHDPTMEASTSAAHPLSAMWAKVSQVPEHDPTTGSSTVAQPAMHPMPVPVEDPAVTAEASTAEHWVPVAKPKFYQKPWGKKLLAGAASAVALTAVVAEFAGLGDWLYHKFKKD